MELPDRAVSETKFYDYYSLLTKFWVQHILFVSSNKEKKNKALKSLA